MSKLKEADDEIKKICEEIQQVMTEHDSYVPDVSDDELTELLHSLPIRTLKESLFLEHKKPLKRFSLLEMNKMSALRKKKDKLINEFQKKESELTVLEIDEIIEKIGSIK